MEIRNADLSRRYFFGVTPHAKYVGTYNTRSPFAQASSSKDFIFWISSLEVDSPKSAWITAHSISRSQTDGSSTPP